MGCLLIIRSDTLCSRVYPRTAAATYNNLRCYIAVRISSFVIS